MTCGLVYRHPNGGLGNFQNYINSAIDKIHRQNKQCIVMGDFNLDLLKFESHAGTDDVMNNLGTHFFQPHILQPTRITNHSGTLIDNIFCNFLEHFTISCNIVYDVTDHLPNFLIINNFSCLISNIKIYKRDYSKYNETDLINQAEAINWQDVLFSHGADPSNMFDSFYSEIFDSQTSDSFYIYPPTSYEIKREIMGLKISKAVGPCSIPIKVLKLLQNVMAKPLEILFNTSFSTGIVPENFKLARVVPVFKKGDHSNLNNYRPISLLSRLQQTIRETYV